MIVGHMFPGDDNEALAWMQHDMYDVVISDWLWRSKLVCARAEVVLGVESDLGVAFRGRTGFDHRGVQQAHDLIAAYFRFRYDPLGPLFSALLDRGDIQARWQAYAYGEVTCFVQDLHITHALLTAVAYENTERGYTAGEAVLKRLLRERYREMFEAIPQHRAHSYQVAAWAQRQADVQLEHLDDAIGLMARDFYTKDIADAIRDHHPAAYRADEYSLQLIVGRYLSIYRGDLQIHRNPDSKPGYGRRWTKMFPS